MLQKLTHGPSRAGQRTFVLVLAQRRGFSSVPEQLSSTARPPRGFFGGNVEETFLYRHFDSHGCLLYVGISLNAVARLAGHREQSHWFSQIRRVEMESFADRDSALNAEALAIKSENPKFNIKPGKYRPEKLPRVTDENIRSLLNPNEFIPHARVCEILKLKSDGLTKLFVNQKIGYSMSYYMPKMNVGIVEYRGQHIIDFVELSVR